MPMPRTDEEHSYSDLDLEGEKPQSPQLLSGIWEKARHAFAKNEKKPRTDDVSAPPLISRRNFLKTIGILTGGFAVLGAGTVLINSERGRREREEQERYFGIEIMKKLSKIDPFTQPLSMTSVLGGGKFDEHPTTIRYSRVPIGDVPVNEQEYLATKYRVRLYDDKFPDSIEYALPFLEVPLEEVFQYMTQEASILSQQDPAHLLHLEKMRIETNPFSLNAWLEKNEDLQTLLQNFLDQAREILHDNIVAAVHYLDENPPNTSAYDGRLVLSEAGELPLILKQPRLDLEFDLGKNPEPSVSWSRSSWQFSSQYTFFINGQTGEPDLRTTLYYLPTQLSEIQKKRLAELWHTVARAADQKLATLFFRIAGDGQSNIRW